MRSFPILLPAFLGLLLALPVTAQEQNEAAVKAAFIYNFTKFVEWPADGGPLQLCLLGETDPLLAALTNLEGKQSQGRSIRIRSVGRNADDLEGCSVVILGASETARVAVILSNAQKHPALTVSEIEHFADAGGMIGLVVNDSRVQFEINVRAAQRANLKLSAQLLKLSQRVKR